MIYLDHAATSPMRPEVAEAMASWWGIPANPASVHRAGQRAAAALEDARRQVAVLVGGRPEGVVFTSGATEANHLFIAGAARRAAVDRRRWVRSPIEHPCVGGATDRLAEAGWTIDRLPVDGAGVCSVPDLPPDAAGLSLMAANHETGVRQPVERALEAARAVGAVLHVDATQAAGKVPLDLGGVDGVVLSGHKLGGPPGIGALILPDGEPFPAMFPGGAQERGRRPGTVPTALAVGFGVACALALKSMEQRREQLQYLRWILEGGLAEMGARIVGGPESEPDPSPEGSSRIPGITLAIFDGVRGESLVQALDLQGLCLSSGAACASGSLEASPVLTAMGDPSPSGGLRVSLGWSSTQSDVEGLLETLPAVLAGVRAAAMFEG